MKTLTVGHTPDMDDAFMFYGMAEGKVGLDGIRIQHVIEDIQTLNQRALRGELDVTAISAASYPAIADTYWVLSIGSSVGRAYGPLVVASRALSPAELRGKRIAIPGLHTTAYLALRLAIPECVPVEMSFETIPDAVLKGGVEAGVVIHERQLTYRDQGLLPILDLGMWWQQQTNLPLPLGLNAVKQSLGKPLAMQFAGALRDSILYAMTHQDDAIAACLEFGRGIDAGRARQFVGMYVNEDTLDFPPPCQQGLRRLYERAHAEGLIPRIPPLVLIGPPEPSVAR